MYRPSDIKAGLSGLIGWRQHYDVASFKINDSLTASSSGQYFQEFHPLITLENIKSVCPKFEDIVYPTWSSITAYKIDDIVSLASVLYKAKAVNTNKSPDTNASSWEPYDAFSDWIKEKTDSSILRVIRSFWDEKMGNETAKNILEDRSVFNGAGRMTDVVTEVSNLAGFELVPIRADGVTTKLNRVGLQFTGTGDITLYLMHSSQMDPIKEITITRTKNGSMEWFDLPDWFLPYAADNIDSGGSWYVVYDQANISGQKAIKKDMDWSHAPCSTCDYQERSGFDIWSKYLEIHPFKVVEVVGESLQMWDVRKNLYTYTSNYGINLQLTIECDVTDLIIQQKKAFQSVIGLQLAADMLREFAYNPNFRIGRTQQNFSRLEILYELDGDSQGYKKSGVMHQLCNALKAVSLDTNNYSNICFPIGKKGIKYKTT